MSNKSICVAVDVGRIGYMNACELQKHLHSRVVEGVLPNLLLLLEHPHVYTLGRRGDLSDILATPKELSEMGVDVHAVDRGGEVTYHGPGQLVGYPIIDLRTWGGGPLKYMRALEEVLIATLADFKIPAGNHGHPTGVWVGESKIAALGVKIGLGVTTHGFALNVNPDLSYFDHIVPCGMLDSSVTSMSSERSDVGIVSSVIPILAHHFGRIFDYKVEWATLESLCQKMRQASPT